MKLALHIGTARTGTTTLQVWCAANRAGLDEQGVCYPTSPGDKNHRRLMVYALDTIASEPVLTGAGIRSESDHEAFRSKMRDDLSAEMAVSRDLGQHTWLMSSELLHSRIAKPSMITRLHALLRPHFDEITVYLHLRPQVELLISNASQSARNGKPVNRADMTRHGVSAISNFFNYNNFIANWEAVFGAPNLRLVPYRRIPDITHFMISELQIDDSRLPAVVSLNPSLDWQALALSNVVHSGFAKLGLGKPPGLYLDELKGTDRLQLGRALAQELQARFDDCNTKLANRRSDITFEELTPDWTRHDEVGNLDIVEAPCLYAPEMAQVLRRFAQDRAMEQWRRHMAEGRLAALTGDVEGLEAAKHAANAAAAELDAFGVSVVNGSDAPNAGTEGSRQ